MKQKDDLNQHDIEITTKAESIEVKKENGTHVNYYLFNEFEIHENRLPPNVVQEWHKHDVIEEVILVKTGQLLVETIESKRLLGYQVQAGSIVQMHNSLHRIINPNKEECTFTVFRFVPNNQDQRTVIKKDKIVFEEQEISQMLASSQESAALKSNNRNDCLS